MPLSFFSSLAKYEKGKESKGRALFLFKFAPKTNREKFTITNQRFVIALLRESRKQVWDKQALSAAP